MPRAPRRLRTTALAVLCLAGLGVAAGAASAQAAEPGQVIGYAKAGRGGPSQVWDLPPDKPYLYVPTIPAALDGRIMAIETGPEVGVALFKSPYFTSRDQGCQPALGSVEQPGRAWLGATARFAPAPAGQASAPPPDAGQGYGSLIVYRADLGPPPGALIMARRVTLGLRCANPVHKTVYNRIFVPVAEAPETARCFDLVGNYPGSDQAFQLDFIKSDRLVMMMPGDLSGRYEAIRHDYTVTLYTGLSCTGAATALNSRDRDIRLAQMDFRDRARSLRLRYDYGNADAFLVRKQTPPPATATREPEPAAEPVSRNLAVQAIEDPAVGQAQPPSPPIPAPELPPLKSPAAPPQKPQIAAKPKPVAPSTAAAKPAAPAAAKPAPQPAVESPAETARAVAVGEPLSVPAPKRQTGTAAPSAPPSARTIPKLSPRLTLPGAQTAALPRLPKTFNFPAHDLYRLNHCLQGQSGCGEPAATAWCRGKGFSKALAWTIDENIGAIFPTITFRDQEVCAGAGCDGFKTITCTPQ